MDKSPDFMRWHQIAKDFLGEEFFSDIQQNMKSQEGKGPKADVYHGANEVVVAIDLPGIENVNSIELKVEGDVLWIKGYFPSPYQSYQTTLVERKRGEFQKSIPLGATVSRKYTARYTRGVLELRFPRIRQQSGQRLKVKNKNHR